MRARGGAPSKFLSDAELIVSTTMRPRCADAERVRKASVMTPKAFTNVECRMPSFE
jgi:hypothetical protein